MINIGVKFQLLLFILISLLTSPVIAQWSGSLRTGYSYTNNFGTLRTIDQGLGTSATVSRSAWTNQANLAWQSITPTGGLALDTFGLFDKSSDNTSDIKDVAISASLFRALNANWLYRLSADYDWYRYDAVPVSGYSGYGSKLTVGYFGDNKQGLDLTLAWHYEDHNADPLFQYDTNRLGLLAVYYLPHAFDALAWSVQGQARRNNASENFRDYNAYLFGLNVDSWHIGPVQGFASLQWRRNVYDDPVVITANTTNNMLAARFNNERTMGMPGGGAMGGGGMGMGGSTESPAANPEHDLKDRLLAALLTFTYPITPHWNARLSGEAGRYTISTTTDTQNYYSVFAGIQWEF